jgi:hypothetical protein
MQDPGTKEHAAVNPLATTLYLRAASRRVPGGRRRKTMRLPMSARPVRLAVGIAVLALAAGATVPPAPVTAQETTQGRADPTSPGATLRVGFGRLLGEHAFLMMDLMRAEAERAPELVAVRGSLAGNSADISAAVASVYGDQAGERFAKVWRTHIDALVRYARAKAEGDARKQQAAVADLDIYRRRFGALLRQVIPEFDPKVEAQALALHVRQLLAFADDDYSRAYTAERAAFHHMFGFGDALALAIMRQFPGRYPEIRNVFSPSAQLRVDLDRLLGEHLLLAAEAMRTNLTGARGADAATATLGENSQDLADAVGLVYGEAQGQAFGDVWRIHVDAYLRYLDAVRLDDAAIRSQVIDALRAYAPQVGAFFAAANPNLDASAVSELIRHHAEALLSQVDAYEGHDYPRAYATVREAYDHMFVVGDALAAAIAAQFPDRFSDIGEIPPTDTVGPLPSDGLSTHFTAELVVNMEAICRIQNASRLAGTTKREMASRERARDGRWR